MNIYEPHMQYYFKYAGLDKLVISFIFLLSPCNSDLSDLRKASFWSDTLCLLFCKYESWH